MQTQQTADYTKHPKALSIGLFVLLGILFFLNLGTFPLFDLDEGAFSEATREMLQSGNFINITLEGEPRHDKPILIYWVQAVSVSLFGLNEWGLRLPSALASLLWMWAIWHFTSQQFNVKTAFVATLMAATSAGITMIGKAATADALFNLCLALTAFGIIQYFQDNSSENRKTLRSVWLWMGLGFLTKGPAALILPAIPAVLYAISSKQTKLLFKALTDYPSWIIFLSVILPWYGMVWFQSDSSFIEGFILEHNLKRFTSTMEGHGGSYFYYFLALPLVLLPYSGLLFSGILRTKTAWKNPVYRFSLIWLATAFAIFSFSGTQLPHYIIYGLSPLFPFLAYQALSQTDRWLNISFSLILPTIFLGLAISSPYIIAQLSPGYEKDIFSADPNRLFITWPWALAVLTLSILTWIAFYKQSTARAVVLIGVLSSLFLTQVLAPAIADLQQSPVKSAAQFAREKGVDVVAWKIYMPSFSVYRQAITPYRAPEPNEWVFTRKDRLKSLHESHPEQCWVSAFDQGAILLLQPTDCHENQL